MRSRSSVSEPIDFRDRVIIVTGAGGGLGRAHALEFARRGARVVVNDIGASVHGAGSDSAPAERVVAEIEALGGEATASFDSVASVEGGRAIVEAALSRWGRLDGLVNNAGNMLPAEFEDVASADIAALLDVHVKGAFHVTQPAFTAMRERGYGRIVLTASSAGVFGTPGLSAYGAAKTAMLGLLNVLALEGREHGILVNAVLPMGKTRMGAASRTERRKTAVANQASRARFISAIRPEAVSALIAYLASDRCAETQGLFSAAAGRYARVFVGLTDGWMAEPGKHPDVEDIAQHFEQISDTSTYVRLACSDDEVDLIVDRLDAFSTTAPEVG
jgi:NAD(P)-dependent dehydrogenase (short-subunit alcohol dehydrogenase family)